MYLLLKGVEKDFLALTGLNTGVWEACLIFKLQQVLASKDIKDLKPDVCTLSLCSIVCVIPSAHSWTDEEQGVVWK